MTEFVELGEYRKKFCRTWTSMEQLEKEASLRKTKNWVWNGKVENEFLKKLSKKDFRSLNVRGKLSKIGLKRTNGIR